MEQMKAEPLGGAVREASETTLVPVPSTSFPTRQPQDTGPSTLMGGWRCRGPRGHDPARGHPGSPLWTWPLHSCFGAAAGSQGYQELIGRIWPT